MTMGGFSNFVDQMPQAKTCVLGLTKQAEFIAIMTTHYSGMSDHKSAINYVNSLMIFIICPNFGAYLHSEMRIAIHRHHPPPIY